jgi:hypothetical protein
MRHVPRHGLLHASRCGSYGVPGGGRFRTPCNTFSDPDTACEEHLPRATPHDPHASARTKHTSRHALPPPDSATSPRPSRHSATPERRPDDVLVSRQACYLQIPRASAPNISRRCGAQVSENREEAPKPAVRREFGGSSYTDGTIGMIYRDCDHERTARPKLGAHGSFQRCCLDSGEARGLVRPWT